MPPKSQMLSWDEAQTEFPAGHLVSGYHDRDRLRRLPQTEQLILSMQRSGRFACRLMAEDERRIEILFESEEDAAKLGDTLGARKGAAVAGYASHRWFEYTPLKFRVIAETLKSP